MSDFLEFHENQLFLIPENMKDELKTYLKELSNKNKTHKTPSTIESAGNIFTSSGNFTNY